MTTLRKIKDFSHDQTLINQLFDLTRPSYIDNTAVLEREIKHCNEIYLLYKDRETLVAFFMVNFEKLEDLDTYYLGLSGCHNDYKGLGFAKLLYKTFFADCVQKETELNRKVLCWWTTASPIPYEWFNKNINNCEPDLTGNISENGKEALIKIAKYKFPKIKIDEMKPFILKGVAEKTLYSDNETFRLETIKNKLNISAFGKYPINEKEGDRYLMIGYAKI